MLIRQILLYLVPIITCLAPWSSVRYLPAVGKLPADLTECSGMAILPSDKLIMINDSGNEPELFVTDTVATLLQRIPLPQIENLDWEEVLYHDGHLYVGDFGNNANRRRDLHIYKMAIDDSLQVGEISEIRFRYARQTAFPPPDSQRNYDMEAMVAAGDSLYLFSKNRTDPFTGYTYMHSLPTTAGEYVAELRDSLLLGEGQRECNWVTGAALNTEKSRLCLLGYQQMWILKDFQKRKFLRGKLSRISFDEFTQKEAIAFLKPSVLLIADEKNLVEGGFLYRLSME